MICHYSCTGCETTRQRKNDNDARKLNVMDLLQNLLCSLVAGLIIELINLGIKGAPKLKGKKAKQRESNKGVREFAPQHLPQVYRRYHYGSSSKYDYHKCYWLSYSALYRSSNR